MVFKTMPKMMSWSRCSALHCSAQLSIAVLLMITESETKGNCKSKHKLFHKCQDLDFYKFKPKNGVTFESTCTLQASPPTRVGKKLGT